MDVKPLPEIIPIIEVELSPVWRIAVNGQLREMDHILVAILAGIAEHCKLTHAARAAGITHRHARNLIKGWSDFHEVHGANRKFAQDFEDFNELMRA